MYIPTIGEKNYLGRLVYIYIRCPLLHGFQWLFRRTLHLSSSTWPEISAQDFMVGTGRAADPETMYLSDNASIITKKKGKNIYVNIRDV